MNPALAALAAVTIAGAVLAVTARDVRATVLGLLVVLLGAPLIADPWPDPLAILVRIAATLLAIRLVAIGVRGEVATGGTRIGWPAEALLAAAAAVVGFGSHGLGAPGLGAAEAQAAGFAMLVLAAAPLIAGRDVLRLAVGALLLLVGATSIRTGLDSPPSQAGQLVDAVLTIAIGGAIGVIGTAARAAGGLTAIGTGRPGELARRLPDAHRLADRPTRTAAPDRAAAGPEVAPARPRRPADPDQAPATPTAAPATPGPAPASRKVARRPADAGPAPRTSGPPPSASTPSEPPAQPGSDKRTAPGRRPAPGRQPAPPRSRPAPGPESEDGP